MTVDTRIAAFLEGDRQAGASLLSELLPRVRNVTRALLGNDLDVDDVAQQVMVEVIRGLPGYRGESTFVGWAGRITVRVALESARRARARRRQELELDGAAPAIGADVLPFRPASAEGYHEKRVAMQKLDQLPLEQRSAIVSHHVLGFTVGEIAAIEGASHETVRSRLRLGMRKLRQDPEEAEQGEELAQ